MKTLLLSDETYALLEQSLERNEAGREVLRRFATQTPLPSDRALVALARADEPPPPAIAEAVARRDAARDAEQATRAEAERLLLEAHAAGVGPRVLMRWFGYGNTRLFQLLAKRRSEQETRVA